VSQILAGDFGGTRARLALFEIDHGGPPRLAEHTTYLARDVGGVEGAVTRFLDEQAEPPVAAATFGVAGAVADNRALLTNLGWEVDGGALASRFGFPVELDNDLVATALGLSALGEGDVVDLNPHAVAAGGGTGNGVLLGAGTGLGVALLVWSGEHYVAAPSEGGHIELAARDDEAWALRQFLAERFGGRVSVERVVSGSGLRNLYDFFVERCGLEPGADVVARLAAGADSGKTIAEAGLDGSCGVCTRVLDRFASTFGSFAGDMVLVAGAYGGVYLGGGVSVRLARKLLDGTFLRAFADKGRLSSIVENVPVKILLRPDTAILGAAQRAAELVAAG
jgi:glucokinase